MALNDVKAACPVHVLFSAAANSVVKWTTMEFRLNFATKVIITKCVVTPCGQIFCSGIMSHSCCRFTVFLLLLYLKINNGDCSFVMFIRYHRTALICTVAYDRLDEHKVKKNAHTSLAMTFVSIPDILRESSSLYSTDCSALNG